MAGTGAFLPTEPQSPQWSWGATNRQIHLISLTGQAAHTITVKDRDSFASLDWAADGKGFFIPSNPHGHLSTLLYVDLAGNTHSFWQVQNYQSTWGVPSHNGKYLAISAPSIECNA